MSVRPAFSREPFSRELRRALFLISGATAVIVAAEFIVVGLLPVLARDLGTTLAQTGWLVSAFALSAAILGPPLTLAATAQPPQRVLIATLLLFACGNMAAVIQPTFPTLMAVRTMQGAALPVFISVGTATVSALAPPGRRGAAIAFANTGFVIGLVVALPAGVALAEGGTWWPSFLVLAMLALVAAALIALGFPAPSPATQRLTPGSQAALLLRPLFTSHIALTVAVFAAMFAAYTYLAAWLEIIAGLQGLRLALALAAFGAVGLIGNAAAARWGERAPLRATGIAVVSLAFAAVAVSLVPASPLLLVPLFALWGIAHTACVALCQVRVTLAGGPAPAFAMAMNIASANLGIALGAFAGGLVVDRWGIDAIGWGPLGLSVVVVALVAITGLAGRQSASAAGVASVC